MQPFSGSAQDSSFTLERRKMDSSSLKGIFWVLSLLLMISATVAATLDEGKSHSRIKRKSERLTAYACENSRLNISCGVDQYLDIIRANYGRFSITICNDHGNTEWKVDCQAGRTLRAMQARCGNKNICDVPVDSSIFGDPCPGTFKYIEVHYACRRDPVELTSTTGRPLPHWFPAVESNPSDWSNLNHLNDLGSENATEPVDFSPNDTMIGGETFGLNDETATQKIIKVKVPKVPHNFDAIQRQSSLSKSHLPIDIPTPSSTTKPVALSRPKPVLKHGSVRQLQVMANFTQYCHPVTSRGLYWNWTKAGDTAVMQCPEGSTGFAKWSCEPGRPQAIWSTENNNGPSLYECLSIWLSDLDSKLRSGSESVINSSKILTENSSRKFMYGGDIVLATRMLKHMSERMHYDTQRTADAESRELMVTTLVKNVVRISSNLLNSENHKSWSDLGTSDNELGRAVTALMVGLEENAFLLADSVTSEKIIIKPTENILLSIRVMQSRNTHRQKFPSVEENISTSWTSTGDSIELASQALLANGNNGAVRVVFAAYHQLDKLLQAAMNTNKRRSRRKSFLNSKVICASLGRGRHIELPEPVTITLRHLQPVETSNLIPQCVYWDYLSNDWSRDGCKVINSNETHTRCQCNHLTNFALMMTEGKRTRGYGSTVASFGSSNNNPKVAKTSYSPERAPIMSKNVSTIVAAVATLISVCVIAFFATMGWRRLQVSSQCRSALGKSGLPCFHKGKESDTIDNGTDIGDNESTKDKGNKGNFYTVTPKLNFNFNRNNAIPGNPGNQSEDEETAPELLEAQQFFEHMIALQKNQDTLVSKSSRRASANLNNVENEDEGPSKLNNCSNVQNSSNNPNNIVMNDLKRNKSNKAEVIYPKRNNYARALSPYNHIYMEIDNNVVTGRSEVKEPQAPPVPPPVYEPLSHVSETYMMSTLSDLSEDNYNLSLRGLNYNSDVSRQSSSRESRPLIRGVPGNRNLLQTISGVLHSQSVRLASGNPDIPQHLLRSSLHQNHSHNVAVARDLRNCATLHHPSRNNTSHAVRRSILGLNFGQQPQGNHTLTRFTQSGPKTVSNGNQTFILAPVQPGVQGAIQLVPGQIQEVHSQVQQPLASGVHPGNQAQQATIPSVPSTLHQPQFAHPVTSQNGVQNGVPNGVLNGVPNGVITSANV